MTTHDPSLQEPAVSIPEQPQPGDSLVFTPAHTIEAEAPSRPRPPPCPCLCR